MNGLRRFLRVIFWIVAVLIIVLALCVTAARVALPYASGYKKQLENVVSSALGQPVTIQSLGADWYGLWPELDLNGVKASEAGVSVQNVSLRINLLSSLWHQTLRLSQISIDGASVIVKQSKNAIQINKTVIPLTGQKASKRKNIAKMLGSVDVALSDINFTYQNNQRVVSLHVHYAQALLTPNSLQITGRVAFNFPFAEKTQVYLNAQGDLNKPLSMDIHAYLNTTAIALRSLLGNRSFYDQRIADGTLGGQVWLHWKDRTLKKVQSQFKVDHLALKSVTGLRHFSNVSANIAWKRNKSGWVLSGDHVYITYQGHDWPVNDFLVNSRGVNQSIYMDYINLGDMADFVATMPVNKELYQALSKVKPQGVFRNVTFIDKAKGFDLANLAVSASFYHVTTQPWKTYPGVKYLNGRLVWNAGVANLSLNSDGLLITDDALFTAPLRFNELNTQMTAKLSKPYTLSLNSLYLNNNDLTILGSGKFKLDNNQPKLSLLLSTQIHHLGRLKNYAPTKVIAKDFKSWFVQAFKSGAANGAFLVHGDLNHLPFDHSSDSFLVDLNLQHSDFSFSPEWPSIQDFYSNITMNGTHIHVKETQGHMMQVQLKNVVADIPIIDISRHVWLRIIGTANSSFQNALDMLDKTPLKSRLSDRLRRLKMNGDVSTLLQLRIPVDEADPDAQVYGRVKLNNGRMTWFGNKPQATNISGLLYFSGSSVEAKKIQGDIFGEPFKLHVDTVQRNAQDIAIDFNTILNLKKLQDLIKLNFNQYVSGASPVQGTILVPLSSEDKTHGTELQLKSQLQGISVKLPEPLKKNLSEKVDFYLDAQLRRKTLENVRIQYDHKADIAVKVIEGKQSPQYNLTAYLKEFDWKQWHNYFKESGSKGQVSALSFEKMLSSATLKLDRLDLFNQQLSRVSLKAQPEKNSWLFGIQSNKINGQVYLPENWKDGVIEADFKTLELNPVQSQGNAQSPFKFSDFPSISFKADKVIYGRHDFGALSFKLKKKKQQYVLQNLKDHSRNLNLKLDGVWSLQKPSQFTSLSGEFESKDMQALFKEWGVAKTSLRPKSGKVEFKVRWSAGPLDLSLNNVVGQFDVNLGPGQVVNLGKDANEKLGLGRLVTALSVQSIFQTLTFQSTGSGKGYDFTSMNGKFDLQNGNLTTKGAKFAGVVADIQFSGLIALIKKSFDLKISVIPHVTSSIPVVAGVVINPIFGVASWFANEVLSPEINKITTYKFTLTGPWSKPNLVSLNKKGQKNEKSQSGTSK